ncbi:hypothetical protein A3G06_00920 [Candidatus Nomurabacteria bacterium RIFCSPLOWO2_12_FULL_46_14]|uniref:Exonuclease domain-containing protein n=1 Tax=Candidatus Nomurabacteria bacterium RIFCSPLOWO2_12_FULL_46_14 TaxID=1801797 RepID=A0A1F6Y966_9BACT|nr:MAG: hypothetical protein A3G06_00920 [Candidatus Nomurabacteria bacterium RIFCSPLOWO2_12_FULL_46_14]
MRKHNLAFIDIETTGPLVAKHEIIEIGCIVTSHDLQIIDEFETKVTPERIEDADPVALKINHYDPALWEGSQTLPQALEILSEKVKDAIMVGHNVAFDAGFLDYAFQKSGIPNSMHYHRLDTVSLAWAKLHAKPDINHFSLRELCLYFGIKNARPHSALADARATYELYKKLMLL